MAEQNYKNHIRLVGVHLAGYVITLAILVLSIVKFCRSYNTGLSGLLVPAILILIAMVLLIVLWYCRSFALRAHDKAIRAEENLRFFVLTGKLPDNKLRMGQIIALRFAPDNEFVGLAKKAVEQNLSPKQIKQSIQNWKPDYNRV